MIVFDDTAVTIDRRDDGTHVWFGEPMMADLDERARREGLAQGAYDDWIGEPVEERPADLVLATGAEHALIVALLRGPMGHPGPAGMTGAPGRDVGGPRA